jgi:anthranilate/para-aminobenzoate synthase component I
MLEPLGPVAVASVVEPADVLAGCPAARRPLLLAPATPQGWFEGTTLLAIDPVTVERAEDGASLAGALLDRALASGTHAIVAVVLDYEGSALCLRYERGLALTAEGWRTWGDWGSDTLPEPVTTRPLPTDAALIQGASGDLDEAAFIAGVRAVREAVAAGDVYVLNLTYRLTGSPTTNAPRLFRALLQRGGAAMSAALVTPERSLLSISPERFVAIDGREAAIEPIKGTRPRGSDPSQDAAYAGELAASAKERAEHVMIVDLERNDLGRVSEPGSVRVRPLAEVVPTPYCHQMVSVVRGTLREDVSMRDVLDATFPCGSVTGAPKISAMRHIARLEASSRGAYCGSLLVATAGRLDSSVLIRTAEIETSEGGKDRIRYGTGGGITYDSDPEQEWAETLLKAGPVSGMEPDRSR